MRRYFSLSILFAAMALSAGASAADEKPISEDAWRALVTGKTLHYFKDGELYGREYYNPDGKSVIFRFPNGQCAEGRWVYTEGQFCFGYVGEVMCFEHVEKDGEILIRGIKDGDEQLVDSIVDAEPLTCSKAVES